MKLLLLLSLAAYCSAGTVVFDAWATTPEQIIDSGYPVEVHEVETADEYINTIHRIPYGKACGAAEPKKGAVIVQHGDLSSSAAWTYMGPEHSLGYFLADHCYDVWLSNSRGNTYSQKHKYLSPRDKDFWEFTWHEMGIYDTPALIDYILALNGESSLYYIGHSQGTTQFFVMASERPEYTSKVRLGLMMGPGAYMGNTRSPPMIAGAAAVGLYQSTYDLYGPSETNPHTDAITTYGLTYCTDLAFLTQPSCAATLFYMAGEDKEQLNYTRLPVIYGHDPAGASSKQVLHFLQNIHDGTFKQFDYGSANKNEQHYGQAVPPAYDLSKITIPTSFHYADNDLITVTEDALRTASEMNQQYVVGTFKVPYPAFNHLDYMFAIDAFTLIYQDLINLMEQYP